LNLGLRDIAVLAECIIGTARLGLDFGSREILADYGRRRNLDSIVSSSAFDVLHKIFSLEAVSLRIARQLGTSIFQNNIQIKALLTKEATGLAGSYPEIFDAVNASRLSA
jgi:2-octaprenyl-6-methoxyphenol hydroxylase